MDSLYSSLWPRVVFSYLMKSTKHSFLSGSLFLRTRDMFGILRLLYLKIPIYIFIYDVCSHFSWISHHSSHITFFKFIAVGCCAPVWICNNLLMSNCEWLTFEQRCMGHPKPFHVSNCRIHGHKMFRFACSNGNVNDQKASVVKINNFKEMLNIFKMTFNSDYSDIEEQRIWHNCNQVYYFWSQQNVCEIQEFSYFFLNIGSFNLIQKKYAHYE